MSKHKVNWVRLPDPLTQNEVNLQINWTADARISAALERQAKLMVSHPDRLLGPTHYRDPCQQRSGHRSER